MEKHVGLYSVILAPGTHGILKKVLGTCPVGYIWILETYFEHQHKDWIEKNLPSCFGEMITDRQIFIDEIKMQITMEAKNFLTYLDNFHKHVEIAYSSKVKPCSLQLNIIPDHIKGKVFNENQIDFYYSLPHPNEYALVLSTQKEVLKNFIL
jgi:hypothetical protein